MNLIDAIKSGRRFRRKSQSNQGPWYQRGSGIRFYEDDIIADDWEVEEVSCYAGFQGLELPLSSRKETA
jgi:hypothetical protein